VLDIRHPEAGELMIPKDLRARRAALLVVVIGEARGDVAVGVQAMKAGAVDFLDESYRPDQLLDASPRLRRPSASGQSRIRRPSA
jgi:FixJ family two-component response regulator